MIVEMSKKSRVYHREGCRYLARINEEDLNAFDIDDERLKGYQSCKCCCNMKSIYKDLGSEYRLELENIGVKVASEPDFLLVKTPSYIWKVTCKPSTQELKLWSWRWGEEQACYLWTREYRCKKKRDLQLIMDFIRREEELAAYPAQYRGYVLMIESYAKENQAEIEYNDTDLYVITDMAAWKISYVNRYNQFRLFHCPFGEKNLSMEEAKRARYHVQVDVPRNKSPYKHIQYLVEHDKAKKIAQVDYRKLPHQTKKQKKYYRQAEKRAKRNSINRVLALLESC